MQSLDNTQKHPAAAWAVQAVFEPVQVDCTTAVVLKILDNKCKMLAGEKHAVLAIYDAVKQLPAHLFDASVHQLIHRARMQADENTMQAVHQARLAAEAAIPRPVMKKYKAFLRDGLFG